MRVGIDLGCWSNRRGFGRFTRNLIPEMVRRHPSEEFVLLIDEMSLGEADLPQGAEVIPIGVSRAPSQAAAADGRRSLVDIAKMTFAARRAACDVVFFPATYSYFPVPGTPTVVTVHDAIAERHPQMVLPSMQARLTWRLKQKIAVSSAGAVITVSNASRSSIAESLKLDIETIQVIREAPEPRFRPIAGDAIWDLVSAVGVQREGQYLLYVGGISPHKNLSILVSAFELVADRYEDLMLLLVGDTEDDPFLSSVREISERIVSSPYSERIRMTGFVSDEMLVALYNGAVATVLPSLGEGFGLTASESAACGTPVVASRDPALTELLGDDALYADSDDHREFARAFDELLSSPSARARYSERVRRRSAEWSWAPAADKVVDVLRQVGRSDG